MNRETFLTLKSFGMLKPFEGFILTANCSGNRVEADPIKGAIDSLKNDLKEQLTEVITKLDIL